MLIFSGSCDVSARRLHQIFYRTNFYKTIDIVWYKTAFLVSLDIFERSVRDPENVETEWHPSLRQHPTKINWYIFLFLYRFLGKTWRPRIKGRVFFFPSFFRIRVRSKGERFVRIFEPYKAHFRAVGSVLFLWLDITNGHVCITEYNWTQRFVINVYFFLNDPIVRNLYPPRYKRMSFALRFGLNATIQS